MSAEQAELLAELERLRRWKAEASEVILGLQDVGKALGLRPGERITGTTAAAAAKRLTARAEAAEAKVAGVGHALGLSDEQRAQISADALDHGQLLDMAFSAGVAATLDALAGPETTEAGR